MGLVKRTFLVIGGLTPATVTLLMGRHAISSILLRLQSEGYKCNQQKFNLKETTTPSTANIFG
jgi:hypothetical protein